MTARVPEELDVATLNERGRHAERVEASRRRYHAARALGLCTRSAAHGPAKPGASLCEPCMAERIEIQRTYYEHKVKRSRRNTCRRCTKVGHNARRCTEPPVDGYIERDARAERQKRYFEEARALGLCITSKNHEKPREGHSRCDACLAKRRKATS